jgi:hypothetical protein
MMRKRGSLLLCKSVPPSGKGVNHSLITAGKIYE